jgi:hypothetical protein
MSLECPHCGGDIPHTCAPLDELWDCKQTAAFLGISESTLEKMRAPGKSGPPFLSLGRPRYLRSDVVGWLKTRKRAA